MGRASRVQMKELRSDHLRTAAGRLRVWTAAGRLRVSGMDGLRTGASAGRVWPPPLSLMALLTSGLAAGVLGPLAYWPSSFFPPLRLCVGLRSKWSRL